MTYSVFALPMKILVLIFCVAHGARGQQIDETTYRIQPGDTLLGIASAVYGQSSRWRAICDANRQDIIDCNSIRAGNVLMLPMLEASATQAPLETLPKGDAELTTPLEPEQPESQDQVEGVLSEIALLDFNQPDTPIFGFSSINELQSSYSPVDSAIRLGYKDDYIPRANRGRGAFFLTVPDSLSVELEGKEIVLDFELVRPAPGSLEAAYMVYESYTTGWQTLDIDAKGRYQLKFMLPLGLRATHFIGLSLDSADYESEILLRNIRILEIR